MKTVRMKIDLTNPASLPERRVDATTEGQIAEHQAIDEQKARQDALKHASDSWSWLDTLPTPDQDFIEAAKTQPEAQQRDGLDDISK